MAHRLDMRASPEMRQLFGAECRSCGLCCIYFASPLTGLNLRDGDGADVPRKFIQIGPRRTLVEGEEYNRYLRVIPDPHFENQKRCMALKGEARRDVACDIYDKRPNVCREFDPGSAYCLFIRRWGSMPEVESIFGPS
jgi:Fe-S-cluster containining protein